MKMIKVTAVIASLMLAATLGFAQTKTTITTNIVTTQLFTPPSIALAVGTNWLSQTVSKLDMSGVYIASLDHSTKKVVVDRGGFATEYVIREYDLDTNLRFRPGIAVTLPADLSRTLVGAGCVFGVVPEGKLEQWLNSAPMFELIAKATKWSNLYGFVELGSQYNEWSPFVGFGGGIKIW